MRKTILIVVLATLSYVASAQFTIGPMVGMNSSKISSSIPDLIEEAKMGWMVGAFARFGNKIYVQPEFAYTVSNSYLKINSVTDMDATMQFNKITVPVMVGWRFINLGVVNFRIMGGPAVSWATNKSISSDNPDFPITADEIKDVLWGFQFGAGVDVFFLALDVRYQWGINNVYKGTSADQSMTSNIWQLTLGWKIF